MDKSSFIAKLAKNIGIDHVKAEGAVDATLSELVSPIVFGEAIDAARRLALDNNCNNNCGGGGGGGSGCREAQLPSVGQRVQPG